jgi:hypothetical protein
MSEAIVIGCGEHILACGQLLNVAKALEFLRVNDGCVTARDEDVFVNFITYYAVTHLHPHPSLCSTIKKRVPIKTALIESLSQRI